MKHEDNTEKIIGAAFRPHNAFEFGVVRGFHTVVPGGHVVEVAGAG